MTEFELSNHDSRRREAAPVHLRDVRSRRRTATSRKSGSSRGEATTYGPAPGTVLGNDGEWSTVPTGTERFATRLLVRRPTDAAHFDGTVVLEWLNVSGGIDLDPVWAQSSAEMLRAGNAWIGVSAQRAGVNGPPLTRGFSQPLELWDPERYGTLDIPNDDLSYGIFTAAARLARAGRLTGERAGRPRDRGGRVAVGQPARHLRQRGPAARRCDRRLPRPRSRRHHVLRHSRPTSRRPIRVIIPHGRPRRAGARARVGVRHPAIVGGTPTRLRAFPAVGARGLDAPGRVRRAHAERAVRARPGSRDGRVRLRGERHAVPLRGERSAVTPPLLGAPRRAAAASSRASR